MELQKISAVGKVRCLEVVEDGSWGWVIHRWILVIYRWFVSLELGEGMGGGLDHSLKVLWGLHWWFRSVCQVYVSSRGLPDMGRHRLETLLGLKIMGA